jgi:hypothetical protein
MIQTLKDTPNTMIGFVVAHEATKEDFDRVVLPAVYELVNRTDKLNYLFVLETPPKNFMIGGWMKEAMLELNNSNKWNRAAIVTDTEGVKSFTVLFNTEMPGEFKGFNQDELNEAIRWVGEQDENSPKQVFQEEGDSKD